MTRELDVEYKHLCNSCKRAVRNDNEALLTRLLSKHSYRVVSKLTGIPVGTLQKLECPISPKRIISGHKGTDSKKPELTQFTPEQLQKCIQPREKVYKKVSKEKSGVFVGGQL